MATVTSKEIFVWQATVSFLVCTETDWLTLAPQPLAVVTSLCRSMSSLNTYGENVKVDLIFDTDRNIFVMVSTDKNYLVLWALVVSPSSSSRYNLELVNPNASQRRRSIGSPLEAGVFISCHLRYRRAIKVDSGLSWYHLEISLTRSSAIEIPIDNTLVIATKRPPAIQSVAWQDASNRSHTQLISKMDWNQSKSTVCFMAFDRPTSLFVWITQDGKAYVVRKPEVITKF
jgi:RAB6A-GEF complex partner protein 1